MERELSLIIVADSNSAQARKLIESIESDMEEVPQTTVTPELVRNIIPIRANPAVGVMFWSNDLQGMATDVKAFYEYLKGEAAVKESAHAAQRYLPDEEALKQPKVLVRTWEEVLATGDALVKDDKIMKGEQLYNVEQDTVPQEVYPPDGEGMLAIYRPINHTNDGTIDDPIPYVYGMDCEAGKYYSYNGVIYRVANGGTMAPCVWPPDSGIWQWEETNE